MIRLRHPLLLATLALASAPASAQLRFEVVDAALPDGPSGAAGMAWTDVDGDGRVDVAISGRDSFPSRVFRNVGGRFEPVPLPANRERNANSAAWGDLDGDGDPDLVLGQDSLAAYETRLEEGTIRLRPFADAGVLTTPEHPRGGFEAVAMGDLDGDGDLDLVAGAYGRAGSFVLQNDGSAKFTLVPRDLFPFQSWMGGAQLADLDGDGRADVLLTGAPVPGFRVGSFLYWNEGADWTADRRTAFAGQAGALGASAGDVDGDGDLDLFVAGWRQKTPGALYLNQGGRRFARAPVALPPRVIGSAFADLDGDGHLDLVVATGYTDVGGIGVWLGDGAGGLRSADVPGLTDVPGRYTGLAVVDVDADGRLDVAAASRTDPVRLFRNATAPPGEWLQVELRPTPGGTAVWGARVIARLEGGPGPRSVVRGIHQQSGYGGHGDPVAHFGVPPGTRVAGVTVHWPDGQRTELPAPAPGQRLRVNAPRKR
ncbi:MAG TPA: CRTAC1 family protein [Longimicrobium sp.]|nr:CRTAC1 family protein [Longimicrobium sp.]